MTTGVSRDNGKLEWSSSSIRAVFAQWQNVLNPYVWRLLFDIIRFNQYARDLLRVEEKGDVLVKGSGFRNVTFDDHETIGHYLRREGYSPAFRNDYLIPMTAKMWTSSPDTGFEKFPAVALVRFM